MRAFAVLAASLLRSHGAVAQSPAPAPAAAAPAADAAPVVPAAPGHSAPSNVAQTVGQRIEQDSKNIGLVARRLLEVQDSIDNVEHEVLGKVFDMQSLGQFLGSHKLATDSEEKLRTSVASYSKEVKDLALRLKHTKEETVKQHEEHLARMAAMRAALASPGIGPAPASGPAPAPAVVEARDLQKSNANLEAEDKFLADQDDNANLEADDEAQKLSDAKFELAKRRNLVLELEKEIRAQHQYADVCHSQAEKLRMQLESEEKRLNGQKMRLEEKEQRHLRMQHALIDTNKDLKTRLTKAKANLATIQTQIISTKERHDALQAQGEVELSQMRKNLGEVRQRAEAAEAELNARIENRVMLEKNVTHLQKEVRRLQDIIMSGHLAELRANNSLIKKQLVQAHTEVMESQRTLVAHQTNASATNSSIQILKTQAQEHASRAREVARTTLAQIAAVKKSDDELRQKAEEAAMQAEAQQMVDCVGIWDKENADLLAELEQCPQIKVDLETASAQVATLTSTVNAAQ